MRGKNPSLYKEIMFKKWYSKDPKNKMLVKPSTLKCRNFLRSINLLTVGWTWCFFEILLKAKVVVKSSFISLGTLNPEKLAFIYQNRLLFLVLHYSLMEIYKWDFHNFLSLYKKYRYNVNAKITIAPMGNS